MLDFTKMQGIGNDYIYMDSFHQQIPDPAALSIRLSERHFGIGADGLILISPSDCADFRMDIYNADGSQAEMCGNGIRCAAKYAYDKGLVDKRSLRVETLAGIKHLQLYVQHGQVHRVRVDMGMPRLQPADIPLAADLTDNAFSLSLDGQDYALFCVSMGNPHAIHFVPDVQAVDVPGLGRRLEHNAAFPQRSNIEFVQVVDRRTLKMRVWERGSGETLACGTGACASVVAAVSSGYTEREAVVQLRGGELQICWDESSGHVYMTGPAEAVFDGVLLQAD